MRDYIKKTVFTAPVLVLAIGLLAMFSRLATSELHFTRKEDLFLAYTVIEILIFILPGIFYVKLKPRGYTADMDLISFGFTQLPLIILMFFVMIFGSFLMSLSFVSFNIDPGTNHLAENALEMVGGNYIANTADVLYVSLALAIVPAFAEEFIFRGVLLREYRMYGMLPSVAITSLLFALLHFNFRLFPFYFLLGIALGTTAYTARSTLASALLHALFNLFSIFAQPFVLNFISLEAGTVLIFYLVTVLFLLFLSLAIGEGERLFLNYSTAGLRSRAPVKKSGILPPSFEILSPTFLLCILFFVLGELYIEHTQI